MNGTPYRDERESLRARIQALESELAGARRRRPRRAVARVAVGLALVVAGIALTVRLSLVHQAGRAEDPRAARDARPFVLAPSHVPIVVGASADDDGILVAMGSCPGGEPHDGFAGYDAATGVRLWSRCELADGASKLARMWAVRDRMILLVGRDLAAVDAADGTVRWRRILPWTLPIDAAKVVLCEGEGGAVFVRSGSHRVRVSPEGRVETIAAFRHCTRVFRDEPWRERSSPPWQSIVDTSSAAPSSLPDALDLHAAHAAPSVNGALVIGARASASAAPVVALVPPNAARAWVFEPARSVDDASAELPPFAVDGQGRVVFPHRQRDDGYRLAAIDDKDGHVEWDVALSRTSGPHVVNGVALTHRSVLVMHDARIAVLDLATGALRYELP